MLTILLKLFDHVSWRNEWTPSFPQSSSLPTCSQRSRSKSSRDEALRILRRKQELKRDAVQLSEQEKADQLLQEELEALAEEEERLQALDVEQKQDLDDLDISDDIQGLLLQPSAAQAVPLGATPNWIRLHQQEIRAMQACDRDQYAMEMKNEAEYQVLLSPVPAAATAAEPDVAVPVVPATVELAERIGDDFAQWMSAREVKQQPTSPVPGVSMDEKHPPISPVPGVSMDGKQPPISPVPGVSMDVKQQPISPVPVQPAGSDLVSSAEQWGEQMAQWNRMMTMERKQPRSPPLGMPQSPLPDPLPGFDPMPSHLAWQSIHRNKGVVDVLKQTRGLILQTPAGVNILHDLVWISLLLLDPNKKNHTKASIFFMSLEGSDINQIVPMIYNTALALNMNPAPLASSPDFSIVSRGPNRPFDIQKDGPVISRSLRKVPADRILYLLFPRATSEYIPLYREWAHDSRVRMLFAMNDFWFARNPNHIQSLTQVWGSPHQVPTLRFAMSCYAEIQPTANMELIPRRDLPWDQRAWNDNQANVMYLYVLQKEDTSDWVSFLKRWLSPRQDPVDIICLGTEAEKQKTLEALFQLSNENWFDAVLDASSSPGAFLLDDDEDKAKGPRRDFNHVRVVSYQDWASELHDLTERRSTLHSAMVIDIHAQDRNNEDRLANIVFWYQHSSVIFVCPTNGVVTQCSSVLQTMFLYDHQMAQPPPSTAVPHA